MNRSIILLAPNLVAIATDTPATREVAVSSEDFLAACDSVLAMPAEDFPRQGWSQADAVDMATRARRELVQAPG